MGDQQANLIQADAVQKIRSIAKGEIAMMHTFEDRNMSIVRPMATAGVDDDGTIWFLNKALGTKGSDLPTTEAMQLTYSVKSRSEYLVLDGHADVLRDQAKINELWKAFDKTWLPDGKDDPSLTLIRFRPHIGHYWDTQHGKMVQLAGMVVGALTGKPTDDGIEGNLHP